MSYPPPRHLLRDLGISGTREPGRAMNRIRIEPGLVDGPGVRLGVLATVVDATGASVALAAVQPDWIATANLSIHLHAPIPGGTVEVDCRPLRVGVGTVVVGAEIRDDQGLLCGSGRMAFARIPGSATSAGGDRSDPPAGGGPVTFSIDGGTAMSEPILARCGLEPVGPGQLRFDKAEYIRNSFGTVNGGVLALAAEAAAVSAGGAGFARDLQIHYLEQIGDGPVGATAHVVRSEHHGFLCDVRIEDRSDGRLVAVADVHVSTDLTREGAVR